MKRRILALLLAALFAVALCACGSTSDGESTDGQDTETMDNTKADLGDYHVEIGGAKLAKDYEGNPVIVIDFTWTNNSDSTQSALIALSGQAFQDGVSLESAIVGDTSVYNSDLNWKDIRPGTTIDGQYAFVLSSETSIVEFELSETFSFSDDMAMAEFDPANLS